MPSTMSNNAKGRKTKYTRSSGKGKFGFSQNSPPSNDGAYSNPRLIHSMVSLLGTKCNTQVKNGGLYQGIFHTVNSNMDIVVGAAHKHESTDKDEMPSLTAAGSQPRKEEVIDELIFKSKDIVCVMFQDVDLKHAIAAVKANGDAPHEAAVPSTNGEPLRALEPWDGGGDGTDIGGLEDDLSRGIGANPNGWAPEDMFRINSEQYGVKSSYDASLPEYTTKLKKDESEDFQKRQARATQLANEIEKSSGYQKRIELEVDDSTTEEDKFSAVSREAHGNRERQRNDRNDRPWQGVRSRGRGKDQGRYNNYSGPGSIQRGPHPSAGYPPSNVRSTTPTNPGESSTGPAYGKPSSGGKSPGALPPRFIKQSGGSGYSRDDERLSRSHDQAYHSYNANQPKPQRQSQGRSYSKNYPSPSPEHSVPPGASEGGSGRNTPQQTLSRSSSASSTSAGQQQQIASPQWGGKHPSASGDSRMHGHPGGPSNVGPMARQHYGTTSGKEGSYSQVLQSGPAMGKVVPVVPMPSAGPPSGYIDNRVKQPPLGAAQGARPRYFFTPPGHPPPRPSAPTMVPAMPNMISQASVARQGQVPQPSHYVASTPSTAPIPSVAASVQRRTSTDNKADQKNAGAKKGGDASSHPGEPGATSGSKDMKSLKEFHQNFRLSDSPTAGSDTSKTVVTSQPRHSPLSPTSIAPKSHGYKGGRPTVTQAGSRHNSRENVPGPPRATPPLTTAPVQHVVHPHVIAQQASQQMPGPVQQQAQSHLPPQQQHLVHPPSVDMVDGSGTMYIQHPAPHPVLSMQPVLTPVPHLAVLPTEQPVLSQQPAINVHSPRSGTSAAPAVNTVSAATGPFVPQQPPTSTPPASADSSQQQQTGTQYQGSGAAEVSSMNTTSGDAGDGGSRPASSAAPSDTSSHQLNPDAKEFTPRSVVAKPSGMSTPTSPTALTHTIPQYYPATAQMQYLSRSKKTGQALLSPAANEQMVNMTPQLAHHLHQTTAGHTFLPGAHPQYPHHHTGPIIVGQQVMMGQAPPQYAGEPVLYPGHVVQPASQRSVHGVYTTEQQMQQQIYAGYPPNHQVHIQAQQQAGQPTPPTAQPAPQPQQPSPPQPTQTGYLQQSRPHSAHTPNPGLPSTSPATNIQQPPAQPQTGVIVGSAPPQIHPSSAAQNVITQNAQNLYHHQQPVLAAHPHMHSQIHGTSAMVPNSPHGASYSQFQAMSSPQYMFLRHGQPLAHASNPPTPQGYIQPASVVTSTPGHVHTPYVPQRPQYPPQMIQTFQQTTN